MKFENKLSITILLFALILANSAKSAFLAIQCTGK